MTSAQVEPVQREEGKCRATHRIFMTLSRKEKKQNASLRSVYKIDASKCGGAPTKVNGKKDAYTGCIT